MLDHCPGSLEAPPSSSQLDYCHNLEFSSCAKMSQLVSIDTKTVSDNMKRRVVMAWLNDEKISDCANITRKAALMAFSRGELNLDTVQGEGEVF